MTWPQVAALSKDVPVAVPVAALEQHGRHMPRFTDSLLLGEVLRRAKEAIGDRVVFAPLMWLGNSHHHLDFPGTLSASPRVYLDLLLVGDHQRAEEVPFGRAFAPGYRAWITRDRTGPGHIGDPARATAEKG